MTVTGKLKEAAGYIKEETGEKLGKTKMANEGRELRNEGRVEDLKARKLPPWAQPRNSTAFRV